MKKAYLQPFTEMVVIGTTTMICGSGDVTSSGSVDGITYGGVDEEGELEPASRRRRRNVWEDEELEEEYLEEEDY